MAASYNQEDPLYAARLAALQASASTNSSGTYQYDSNPALPPEPTVNLPRPTRLPSHRKPVPIATHVEKPIYHPAPTSTTTTPLNFIRSLSRRTKILIAAGLVVLLILIIGLAAGLSQGHGVQDLPLPSSHGGPYTGDLTYYTPGLGACGIVSSNGDAIVAVSHLLYDAVQTSSNPNSNPLCGKMLRVQRDGRSVDLKVVDRCTGCEARDLDVTEDTFSELADVTLGRVTMRWSWLDDVPS